MDSKEPFLSIGVLAHNERLNIEKTLRSLFMQDVFKKYPTETIVVANGCTDETAVLAKKVLASCSARWSDRGIARVEELALAGKANAWNQFVHKLSTPNASMLILMDSDITFLNTNTISSMMETLRLSSRAVVCVDRPVKDIELKTKRTILEKCLVRSTPEIDSNAPPLCGQLYCLLGDQARQIELPTELQGEDGFLRALLLTRGFTEVTDPRRIVLDSGAAHSFASVATIRELFMHEKWIVSFSIVNMLVFERFWRECTAECSAMLLMKRWQEEDPHWLPHYIQQQVQERGWRLLPLSWWTRRWTRLRALPLPRKLLHFPLAIAAAMTDAVIFVAAINDVRRGRAFRYWGRK
jgi:Glycosyl transferase family 2